MGSFLKGCNFGFLGAGNSSGGSLTQERVQITIPPAFTTYDLPAQVGSVIQQSGISITLSGSELPRGVISGTIGYSLTTNVDNSVTIDFHNDGLSLPEGQILIIKYNYT